MYSVFSTLFPQNLRNTIAKTLKTENNDGKRQKKIENKNLLLKMIPNQTGQ